MTHHSLPPLIPLKFLNLELLAISLNRPLAKINYGTMMGYKNLLSLSIRHPNEVTKILCIDSDMDFL